MSQTYLVGIGAVIASTAVLISVYWNAPLKLTDRWIGTTFYVFSHEDDIAEMAPIENLSPYKKNSGKKFIIPDSFGRLQPGKTYDLLKHENGDLYVKQVAVML